jgi:hypothetical protein
VWCSFAAAYLGRLVAEPPNADKLNLRTEQKHHQRCAVTSQGPPNNSFKLTGTSIVVMVTWMAFHVDVRQLNSGVRFEHREK